jgi:hypothetical protein
MLRKLRLGRRTALIAVFLLLFNGNFGFIEFFKDIGKTPQAELVPSLMKMSMVSTWILDRGYAMANTITEYTLNQREFIMGICAFALVIILLAEPGGGYLLAALIAGLSPMFHIYSFAAAVFFSLPLLIYREKKEAIVFFLIVAALAVPQLMYVGGARTESYLQFKPGWVGGPQSNWFTEKQDFWGFWIKNFSPYILLAVLGIFFTEFPLNLMTIFASVMLILLNIFITQPLVQDNRKWLLFVIIIFSASSAVFLYQLIKRFRKAGWVMVALIVLILTLAGIQTVVYWAENYSQILFYKDELRACEFVRNNTEPNALVISDMYRDCTNNWGGRRVFLRLDADSVTWYKGHGIDTGGIKEEMKEMLAGNCKLIKKNGIGYILLDNRNSEFAVNSSFLNAQEKLYERDSFSFYRVRC